jgi:hypothetical protein
LEQILIHLFKGLFGAGLAYLVYRDCKKKQMRHSNLWIIGTFVFPPIAFAYYLYQMTAGRKTELSMKQKFEMELRRQTEQWKKTVAEERRQMELLKKREQEKNKLTMEEIESIKAERLAMKAKRLKELEEERRLQQEEIAKKMRISTDAANNMKMFE